MNTQRVYNAAIDMVDRNVADATHNRRRRPTSTRARAWTAQELGDFLAAARTQRLYPALHLTAFTGMRRGEIVFQEGEVRLRPGTGEVLRPGAHPATAAQPA